MNRKEQISGLVWGLAVGDALGVPVEFMSRKYLEQNPVIAMRAYGTHHQPAGTWSDDTSLSFCLIEQLIEGYDLSCLADKFVAWKAQGYWTAHGDVFDVGIATQAAIQKIAMGISPQKSGVFDEYSNGNGALMRILPLCFYIGNKPIEERFYHVKEVASITHAHPRNTLACFFAVEFGLALLENNTKKEAFRKTQLLVRAYLSHLDIAPDERVLFSRILLDDIESLSSKDIYASGYVIHTLEASIWAFLTTDSYEDAVLTAINLGDDTDTTGSVTGAWAGLYYGVEAIPAEWRKTLARYEAIDSLAHRFISAFLD